MIHEFLTILAAAAILSGVAGAAEPVRIAATNADLAAIAREIGGDQVDVSLLCPPTMNPHTLPLKPSVIQRVRAAELLLTIGLDHEPWLFDVLTASGNGAVQNGADGYVDCSVGIKLLNVPSGAIDRSRGDLHVYGNTHYWSDPENGKIIAVHIMQALGKKRPEWNDEFRNRTRQFVVDLSQQIAGWRKTLAPLAGTPVVLYHQSWNYLMRFCGLKVAGYVEMRPGIEPSPSHVAKLQRKMKSLGVKHLFMEPYFNRSQAETVAAGSGARVTTLPPSTLEGQTYPEFLSGLVSQVLTSMKGEGN